MSAVVYPSLARAAVVPKKKLGQHFLHDRNILNIIADALDVAPGEQILEIGPGLGALTEVLLAKSWRVVALEKDLELVQHLQARYAEAPALQVIHGDATRFDFSRLSIHRWVGNLPYNVASRILVNSAESLAIEQMVAMVQYEVGQRLIAGPGDAHYGLLSVLVQRYFTVKQVCKLGPGAFYPRPKVDSMVVVLHRRYPQPPPEWAAAAKQAAKWAFMHRRKTLRTTLSLACGVSKLQAGVWLGDCGIAETERPENLSVAAFAQLGMRAMRDKSGAFSAS
jgi:16S rRNA (adenine1518-N6/adenine1519-N6)-dimethyltransferase